MIYAIVISALLSGGAAIELSETWRTTSHCKKLKPDWDKLMDEFNGSPGSLVADVDCTGEGQTCGPGNLDLCSDEMKKKIEGHCKKLKPDWDKLMDEFNGSPGSLVADVDCTGEGQTCGPGNLDLCSDEMKKKIEGYMAMSPDRLEGKIRNAIRIVEEEVRTVPNSMLLLSQDRSKMIYAIVISALLSGGVAIELSETWRTTGLSEGHCKKLKPDWDKLMDEFNGSPGSLVADVDCTGEGQSLCEKHEAPRLHFMAGNLDLCSDEMKKKIEGYMVSWLSLPNQPQPNSKLRQPHGRLNMAHHFWRVPNVLDQVLRVRHSFSCKAMSPDRLEGKIRNAIRIVEEEVSHGFAILLHLKVMEKRKQLMMVLPP
eukprot:Skav203066  [mRNA]  locus=scaffold4669:159575:166710:- [translate_table: standard]